MLTPRSAPEKPGEKLGVVETPEAALPHEDQSLSCKGSRAVVEKSEAGCPRNS